MSEHALDPYNYSIHETDNPFAEVLVIEARFDDSQNKTVLLTLTGSLSATAAYTFRIPAGYIADASGEYIGDVIRPLQRERMLLSVDRDQEWKYHAQGVDLGTAWREPVYDDSSWSNGFALFYAASYGPPSGAQAQAGTALPTVDSANRAINTFYFRGKVFSPFIGVTSLRLRSIFDDGGVVYIDGAEVWRFSMPPAPAPITYTNRASRSVTNYSWFPPTNRLGAPISVPLQTGEHVIAVEVHQFSTSQSPTAMALMLSALAEDVCACPLEFAEDLQPRWTVNGPEMPLRVRVNGTSPRYQWFKDGSPIANATNRTYTVSYNFCAGTGRYWVRVTNEVSAIESQRHWIQYGDGPEWPYLLSAIAEANRATIRLQFNKFMSLTWATNPANYCVEGLRILNVTTDGASFNQWIRLHTEPRLPGRFHALTVLNTARATCLTNIDFPPIHAMVDLEDAPLWYNSVWAYHDLGVDLGTDWRDPQYDDSVWPRGPALLGVEGSFSTFTNLHLRGIALNTPLQLTNGYARPTYYFRARFENPFSSITNFYLTHVIDDGAVFYLDGVEVARFRMPQGAIDYSTLSVAGGEGEYQTNGFYTIAPGVHTLAAEVHQSSTSSSDVLFGAAFETFLRAPPKLRITHKSNGLLELLPFGVGTIQSAASLSGVWTNFTRNYGFYDKYEIRPNGSAAFFRIRPDE